MTFAAAAGWPIVELMPSDMSPGSHPSGFRTRALNRSSSSSFRLGGNQMFLKGKSSATTTPVRKLDKVGSWTKVCLFFGSFFLWFIEQLLCLLELNNLRPFLFYEKLENWFLIWRRVICDTCLKRVFLDLLVSKEGEPIPKNLITSHCYWCRRSRIHLN